jgi:Na+/H+ antiporter NhaB
MKTSLKSKESLDWWLCRNALSKTKQPPQFRYRSCFQTKNYTQTSLLRTPSVTTVIHHYRPYTRSKTSEEQRCNVLYHTIVALFLFVTLIGLFLWEIALIAVGLIGIALFVGVLPTVEGNVRDEKERPY